MADQKFVDGLFVNSPNENAPDFIKANLSIHAARFVEWLKGQELTEKGYVNLDLKESREGKLYASVNDWKPNTSKDDNAPF